MTPLTVQWQPFLDGKLIRLRPLMESDFDALYSAGSDPAIWEMHPESDRYVIDKFRNFFRGGIESQGALAIIHQVSARIIGSTRFTNYDEINSTVEVGYTFLEREYWGQGYNTELKRLMLKHAFEIVDGVRFRVGEANLRSRRAVEKLGATILSSEENYSSNGGVSVSVVYQLRKFDWLQKLKHRESFD